MNRRKLRLKIQKLKEELKKKGRKKNTEKGSIEIGTQTKILLTQMLRELLMVKQLLQKLKKPCFLGQFYPHKLNKIYQPKITENLEEK